MNRLRHFLSICTHCIVAVLFLVGSIGIRAEQLCDVNTMCKDVEVTSCCSTKKTEPSKSTPDCCTTTHSDDDEKEHNSSHQQDHLCQCFSIAKNLISPVFASKVEIGSKTSLIPGDLNSYFTLLLISKPFHPPNTLQVS